jgi:hypothetical protein
MAPRLSNQTWSSCQIITPTHRVIPGVSSEHTHTHTHTHNTMQSTNRITASLFVACIQTVTVDSLLRELRAVLQSASFDDGGIQVIPRLRVSGLTSSVLSARCAALVMAHTRPCVYLTMNGSVMGLVRTCIIPSTSHQINPACAQPLSVLGWDQRRHLRQ